MRLQKEVLSKQPIWVMFYSIPIEYWTADGLGHIASAVGRPLFVDLWMETGQRL